MIIQLILAFFSTIGFSVMFNVPRNQLILCGLTGALGWFIYYLIAYYPQLRWFLPVQGAILSREVTATFFATLGVCLCSRFLARYRKMPITVFLVSGIIPMVPGAGIYDTMFQLITGETVQAAIKGVATFKIAGVIGLGIILSLSLPWNWFQLQRSSSSGSHLNT